MSTEDQKKITVYVDWCSQPCRSLRRICDLFKVSDQIVWQEVLLIKGEHFKPDYLAINPCHTVPALTHGDLKMFESTAIIEYLADTFKLNGEYGIPASGIQRYRVINALHHYHHSVRPATRKVIFCGIQVLRTKVPVNLDTFKADIADTEKTIFEPLNALLLANGGSISPPATPSPAKPEYSAADVFAFMELWQFVKWDMADDNFNTYQIYDFEAKFPAIHSFLKALHPVIFDHDLWASSRTLAGLTRKVSPELSLLITASKAPANL